MTKLFFQIDIVTSAEIADLDNRFGKSSAMIRFRSANRFTTRDLFKNVKLYLHSVLNSIADAALEKYT